MDICDIKKECIDKHKELYKKIEKIILNDEKINDNELSCIKKNYASMLEYYNRYMDSYEDIKKFLENVNDFNDDDLFICRL